MKQLNLPIVFMAALFLASSALAAPTFGPIGDPIVGNSWSQWWGGLPGETDLIAHRIASAGDEFESLGYDSFTQTGWDMVLDTPTLVSASGPPVTTIGFLVHFAGDVADPLVVDGALFRGETLIYTTRNVWDGSSWSYEANAQYWMPTRADVAPIPAPGALLLGSMGVSIVGWLRRRRAL